MISRKDARWSNLIKWVRMKSCNVKDIDLLKYSFNAASSKWLSLSFVMRNGSFMLILINQLNVFITLSDTFSETKIAPRTGWLFGSPPLLVCITAFWNLTSARQVYIQQPDKMYLLTLRGPLHLHNITCQSVASITYCRRFWWFHHIHHIPLITCPLTITLLHQLMPKEIPWQKISSKKIFASNNMRPFQ